MMHSELKPRRNVLFLEKAMEFSFQFDFKLHVHKKPNSVTFNIVACSESQRKLKEKKLYLFPFTATPGSFKLYCGDL